MRRSLLIAVLFGLVFVSGASARQNYSLFAAFGHPKPGSWLQQALAPLSPEAREAVERRLKRREGYEVKTVVPDVAAFEAKVAAGRRQEIERGIVRLLETPGAETEAAAFAATAKVYYEWETDPSAPMDEAASATEYLRVHPATIIEPYLRLFQLHRFRSAFEAAVFMAAHPYPEAFGEATIARWRKQYALLQEGAAAGYATAWDALRGSTDIVVRTLADNLDTKPYLYLNVGAHPRAPQQTPEQQRDAAAIVKAKEATVSAIEPALPRTTFEAWLKSVVGPDAPTKWATNDCGEQSGNPAQDKGRDFPMCVEAEVSLSGDRKLYVMLLVGTLKGGVGAGAPKLWSTAIVITGGDPKFINKLADVPAAIKGS